MNKIEELTKQAHKLWKEGKEEQMLPYLREAINLCKQENNFSKQIEILNEYAGALRLYGNYDKAVESINEALELIKLHYDTNNIQYATTLMNKANIYREKKDYFTAEKLMLQSKEIFDKKGDKSYSYIGLLNNLSLTYQEIKDYKRAEQLQLEAISLLQGNAQYNVPLAISYNNLYEIQKKLNKHTNAEENLIKAKDLLSKEVGENHPLYSAVLNNLAELQVKNKNYHKALELYKNALEIVKSCYGTQSDAYLSVKSNYEYVNDLILTLEPDKIENLKIDKNYSTPSKTEKLLDKSRKFSKQVEKLIYEYFPNLKNRICLALVGSGSECLYFDDELSKDHDYDLRCQLFLTDEDYISYSQNLEHIFSQYLENKVIIQTISNFYIYYTSYKNGPSTIEEYRNIPDEYLCSATNGEVFVDNLGEFSKIRQKILNYYPQDLIYKKLAYHLNNIAQSGQYNYPRLLKRNDKIACSLALSEYIKHYMQVVHILNKKYMPFYKWSFKNLKNLEILGEYTSKKLNELISSPDIEKENIIDQMCKKLVSQLNEEHFTTGKIDFLTYQANEITQNIQDENLRKEDNWIK